MKATAFLYALFVALLGCSLVVRPPEKPVVKTGLDVLVEQNFAPLHGKHVGLIVNHSAIDRNGEHLLDLILKNPSFRVKAIFVPEHGFRGIAEHSIANQVDEKTGLPIYSLYDKTKAPTAEELEDIDILIFDIQDIGARFYTYISTMANCMEAAREYNVAFMVLDRPNPIGGLYVAGPLQDDELYRRFISFFPMPVAHGMTIGELATMFNEHYGIQCNLEVVLMEGWRRGLYFDQTGLPWVNPSPNIRNLDEALLYPGVALTEYSNVSVGRGTASPFEIFGAPWIDSEQLVSEMRRRGTPGIKIQPTSFTPDASRHAGKLCHGFTLEVTNRSQLDMVRTGLELMQALYQLYPQHYTIDRSYGLVGNRQVLKMIKEGERMEDIEASWQEELDEFKQVRQQFLIYTE